MLHRGILGIICLNMLLVACGRYSETKVKEYSLHFYSQEPVILQAGQKLVTEYNRMAGLPILSFMAKEDDANSNVEFVQGLNSTDGKLAYGQWVTETNQEPVTRSLEGRPLQKTVYYSMNLEFDYKYFKDRAAQSTDSLEWKTLFVLFCHEVGHGLTMDDLYDKGDRLNIMYGIIDVQDIPSKDFKGYFERARKFLADN